MSRKLLEIFAHPDDEVLACGGAVAKMSEQGLDVYALILGEGLAARGKSQEKEILELREKAKKANKRLGVKEVTFLDFPDNKFDTVALLDIVKAIETVKNRIKPDIIFTHYGHDLNIDHYITYKAVITATRPLPGETVKEIYSFEVLSSTEWGYPISFSPDTFFDISTTMKIKQEALDCYDSEMRNFPHPRSIEGAELNAKIWGMKTGLEYVEAAKCVRCIK